MLGQNRDDIQLGESHGIAVGTGADVGVCGPSVVAHQLAVDMRGDQISIVLTFHDGSGGLALCDLNSVSAVMVPQLAAFFVEPVAPCDGGDRAVPFRLTMAQITMYTTVVCPFCVRAKRLLDHKGVAYEEVDVSYDADLRDKMVAESGRRTVPQIFIDGEPVGGYQELQALEDRGELDPLLVGS